MISPAKLDKLPADMVNLIQDLQNDIIRDVCRRFSKANYLTPTAEWQLYKANQLQLSYNEVNRRIARFLKVRERDIQRLYTDTVKQALKEDGDIYRLAAAMGKLPSNTGEKIQNYFRSAAFSRLLSKGLKNCKNGVRNLCNSMAAQVNSDLSYAMDYAHIQVLSGAFSYSEAIYNAVKRLTEGGLTRVEYPSGRRDNVDVCVRRAVLSSVNKSCCDLQLDLAREVGSKYVEVTAHIGARPSHALWQGQIYCLEKGDPKYPYFYDATGYGTGDGLGGWNCRHNFFPYFPGIDTPYHKPEFTRTENNEYYALTQRQRAMERAVRSSKRELAALDGARSGTDDPDVRKKLDNEFARKSVTLKSREKQLDEFVRDKGLVKENDRTRVVGFNRNVSVKASAAIRDNADHGKYLNAKINRLTDLRNPISITELPHGHGEAVSEIIRNAPEDIRRLLTAYPVQVCNTRVSGVPHFSVKENAVRLKSKKFLNDPRGKYTQVFHESGHFIDHALNRPSLNAAFAEALQSDFDKMVANVGLHLNTNDRGVIYDAIGKDLKSSGAYVHSISDIISGITKGECKGGYGHEGSYWNDSTHLPREAFAHFFEATARNDSSKLQKIKDIFPTAYAEFLNMLK